MTNTVFLLRCQLSKGFSPNEKQRVISKATPAARFKCNRPLTGATHGQLPPIREHTAHAADKARRALLCRNSLEVFQQKRVVFLIISMLARIARRIHAGRAAQRIHLKPGIICNAGQTALPASGFRLEIGVFLKGLACLLHIGERNARLLRSENADAQGR